MASLRSSFVVLFVSALALSFAIAPRAHAQEAAPPRPSSAAFHPGGSSGSSAPSLGGAPYGTRMEHWLVAGSALALGAITVAIGTGLQRYAVDLNDHARNPLTVQSDAAASASTARDFLTAAEVMWSVGAALAGIALTWIIVLSVSTPAPSGVPDAATAASASLRLSPLGVTLEGVF